MEWFLLYFTCTDDIKSRSGSSSSGSDREESDVEAAEDTREDEKAEEPEKDQEETVVPPDKQDEADAESESAVAKDSDIQNSAGDSTEIDVSDSSVPSGSENKPSDDPSGDKEAVKTVDESKQEEEQDRGEFKPTDTALELSPEWQRGSILNGGFSTIIVASYGSETTTDYHSTSSHVLSVYDIWSNIFKTE